MSIHKSKDLEDQVTNIIACIYMAHCSYKEELRNKHMQASIICLCFTARINEAFVYSFPFYVTIFTMIIINSECKHLSGGMLISLIEPLKLPGSGQLVQ